MEKLKYYCNQNNIKIIKNEYGENIKCKMEVTERAYERLQSLVNAFDEDQHLQGNNVMNDGSKNQHFGEGSVGI